MTTPRKIGLLVLLMLVAAGFAFVYPKNKKQVVDQTASIANAASEKNTSTGNEAVDRLPLTPANIVWYANQYRIQHHLPTLTQRRALNESAKAKTTNMILYQYFDHTQPGSNIGFDHFIDDQKYAFIKIGENLAMGDFSTSKEVVDAWMRSPTHRANILDTTYTEIGVSIQEGIFKGKQVVFITQHFGKPRKSCPSIDQSLKTSIGTLTDSIKKVQDEISQKQNVLENANGTPDGAFIDAYNALVTTYNASASQLGELVQKYNAQVKAFDTCISQG
jgi:uncharacterized protein YkwD